MEADLPGSISIVSPELNAEIQAQARRIAELEAALRLCLDDCIDPTEGEVALTRARELLGMK